MTKVNPLSTIIGSADRKTLQRHERQETINSNLLTTDNSTEISPSSKLSTQKKIPIIIPAEQSA